MPHYWLYILLNHSILFPAVAGCVRWKTAPRAYCPFIILLWLGAVNETLSLGLAYARGSNAVNSNIYVLLEFFLLLWQFERWNQSPRRRYFVFAALGAAVWVLDNFVLNSLGEDNSIFRGFYAAVLVGFAVDRLNRLVIFEKRDLIRNPREIAF